MNRLVKTGLLLVVAGAAQCFALALSAMPLSSEKPLSSENNSLNEAFAYNVVETNPHQGADVMGYTAKKNDTSKILTAPTEQSTTQSSRSSELWLLTAVSLTILHLLLMLTDRRHQ